MIVFNIILIFLTILLSLLKSKEYFNNNLKFDVFLINLKDNKDRLDHFKTLWKNSDAAEIPVTRIPAIEGKKVNISKFVTDKAINEIYIAEKTGKTIRENQLTFGAVGCYMSHLEVYRQIKGEYALICEDDTQIPKNLMDIINKSIISLPSTWDIILLSCHCKKCSEYNKEFEKVDRFILTHCYLIRKGCAKFILNVFENKKIENQIDTELSDLIVKYPHIEVYCNKSNEISQNNNFPSRIQK